ncbi:MAG: Rpn family recombination-promoting nuclease/putative transposase [Pseudobutyrivibrio sp.]|nr:Rpn family recombination-promoting nuclease/putative transposase [Pseudobutyrivibrio sp.]
MGRKDVQTKKYMRNPQIFADFFNGYLYEGKEVINWENLEDVDSAGLAMVPTKNGKKRNIQKFRDILKRSVIKKDNEVYYVILGIENQSDIHYAMPVRTMLYNAITYFDQVEAISNSNRANGLCDSEEYLSGFRKCDTIKPVITATIYWGTKTWDGPTSLRQMFTKVDPKLESVVDDCNINLFSIIDMREFPEYRTELSELFNLLSTRNDGDAMAELVSKNDKFKSISRDTAEMMRDFANVRLPNKDKEGNYNMCKAVIDLTNKGRAEGQTEALLFSIKSIMDSFNQSFEQACAVLKIDAKDMERYRKMI